jgi:undecaprenyl-diphosphatase
VILLGAFLGWTALAQAHALRGVDATLMNAVSQLPDWFAGPLTLVNLLGAPGALALALLAVGAAALTRRVAPEAALGTAATIAASLIELGLKHVVAVPPPNFDRRVFWLGVNVGPHLGTPFSYPSGHAARTLGLGLIAAWWGRGRGVTAPLVALVVLAVGLSSVYLGDHWPSDVIGGWLLGAGAVSLAWSASRPRPSD